MMAGLLDCELQPGADRGKRREDAVVAVAPEVGAVTMRGEGVSGGLEEVEPPEGEDEQGCGEADRDERRTHAAGRE
jgi:hypothetical protein